MKVKIITVAILHMLSTSWIEENLFAELTRTVIKEEIQHVDKLIDDLRSEVQNVRSEIKDLRSELQGFMLWSFGIVFAGIFALIGFVLWNRRTALAPAIRKNQELEERENKIESALKKYAQKEPRLKEILKHVGLM